MPEALIHIDAELLAGSRDLLLLAECLVEGYAHGLHRSPYAGSSQEFASYRAFLPGDPPQRIDWKVYGRTDDLFAFLRERGPQRISPMHCTTREGIERLQEELPEPFFPFYLGDRHAV